MGMTRINGQQHHLIETTDRGLAYGDGVFRTVQVQQGVPLLWQWQWQRLCHDAQRLQLPLPEEAWLQQEIALASADIERASVKILLTRGSGPRGYAIPSNTQTQCIIQANPWAGYPARWYEHGVALYPCQLQLARQPKLAGIKHLNRLEQVLARSEWHDPQYQDGLLCDSEGWVIETCMANLWLCEGGQWVTPRLSHSGVAGAVRSWWIDQLTQAGQTAVEANISCERLFAADEVWLCNSLLGLAPVAAIGDQTWSSWPQGRHWQHVYEHFLMPSGATLSPR